MNRTTTASTKPASLALSLLTVALLPAVAAHAGTSAWSALTGLTPAQATPAYTFDHATPPTLQSGYLQWTPSTHGDYDQSGPTLIAMPSLLVIQTQMQFISGTTSNSSRSGAEIQFTIAPNVGNGLWFESGAIFLNTGDLVRGPSVALDTTSTFHTYRTEVNTTTGAIAVFYDNGATPVLTGNTFSNASANGSALRIDFGDGSALASGTSRWISFQHNASTAVSAAPEPTALALLLTALPVGAVLSRRRRR